MADALFGRAAGDEPTARFAIALAEDRQQQEELGARRDPTAAADPRVTRCPGWFGNAEQLRASWDELNLTRQAAIVRAVLDHAGIGPGVLGARTLDPERVQPVWRL